MKPSKAYLVAFVSRDRKIGEQRVVVPLMVSRLKTSSVVKIHLGAGSIRQRTHIFHGVGAKQLFTIWILDYYVGLSIKI